MLLIGFNYHVLGATSGKSADYGATTSTLLKISTPLLPVTPALGRRQPNLFYISVIYSGRRSCRGWFLTNDSGLERIHYEGMDDVILLDFLPKELGLIWCISSLLRQVPAMVISETRSEHGAYILSGQGL